MTVLVKYPFKRRTWPANPISRLFASQAKPPEVPASPARLPTADYRGAQVADADFSGARFQETRFQYARLHGVDFTNADIWGAVTGLVINGVEVEPLIEAELQRRQPGREALWASDPDGVRAAWATIERLWEESIELALGLPEELLHARVEGEWSFLETLRHCLMVDDGFLRQVAQPERPLYRSGVPMMSPGSVLSGDSSGDAYRVPWVDLVDLKAEPDAQEVIRTRRDRMREVREFLKGADADELQRMCPKAVHDAWGFDMPVLHCFWRTVNEELQHHSFAQRDLEALELLRP